MSEKYYIGTREIDGPRQKGDPIRHYFFKSVDTRVHWHDDFEILYVRSGHMKYHVDDRQINISKGDIVIISPYTLHGGKTHDEKIEISVYVFKPTFLCAENGADSISRYFQPIVKGEKTVPVVISKDKPYHRELAHCLDRVDRAECEQKPAFELTIRNELSKFFVVLYENDMVKAKTDASENVTKSIKKAITYIEENYTSKLTVTELASRCGFSQSYFMAIFKQHTGVSCVTYINQVRIASAVKLLKSTDLSILEISEQTGFNSVSLFNRTFKKIVGKTPKELRR